MRALAVLGLCVGLSACASTNGRSSRFDNGSERPPSSSGDGAERLLAEILQMLLLRPYNAVM